MTDKMAGTGSNKFLSRLMFWKRPVILQLSSNEHLNSSEYRLTNKLKRYEKYLNEIENVVFWSNPIISVISILIVNLLFWGFVSLEWRFFGIVSGTLLAFTVYECWSCHVWPEIRVPEAALPPCPYEPPSPRAEALSKQITSCYTNWKRLSSLVLNFRSERPGLFCCGGVLGSGWLLLLARSFSGLVLVYSLLMAVLLGPGLVTHCVPPMLKLTVAQHLTCLRQTVTTYAVSDGSDDEYLPSTNSEDLVLLTRASDIQNTTHDSITSPGSTSDLGLAVMPSHEEDSLASEDLEPLMSLPLDHADDSDSNPDDHQLQFQSGHFNKDSSSDEDAFAKDLEFPEGDVIGSAAARGLSSIITQAMTSNLATSVGLLAAVMRPQEPVDRRRRSTDSDLEDFEVINRDELGS